MKAIEFEEQNVEIAKNQPEYNTLPAFAQEEGIVTYCMELSTEELKNCLRTKKAYIGFANFGKPVQPVAISEMKPQLPIDFRIKTQSNPFGWQTQVLTTEEVKNEVKPIHMAVFKVDFKNIEELKKSGQLWVTVITHNQPLQPIHSELQ